MICGDKQEGHEASALGDANVSCYDRLDPQAYPLSHSWSEMLKTLNSP